MLPLLNDVQNAIFLTFICNCCLGFSPYCPVRKLRHDFRMNAEHLLIPVLSLFASHGTQALRLVAAGGLTYAYVNMHEAVRLWSRDILMKFGERVLEVRAGPVRTR